MRIISPIQVVDGVLTASNIEEDDAPVWAAGTYPVGTLRIYLHRVYEALVETSDTPADGVIADPPTWLDHGATTRWRMFDGVIGQRSSKSGSIVCTLQTTAIINAVALFGLQGTTLHVTLTDSVEGEVYNKAILLQDNTAIVDWYAYFFEPILQREDVVLMDLPSYRGAELEITVDAGLATAECGEVVIGVQRVLGVANFGTGISIQDYSRKERDQFGNSVVVKRRFTKRADFDVTVDTPSVGAVQRALAAVRANPTVFVGDEAREETVIYGFYRNFSVVLSNPAISDCTIEVEGLI